MVVNDEKGVAVAMLAADDAVEIASWRVSEADAVRVIHALIESICLEAGERGIACPEAIMIDFRKYTRNLWV